ncbi:MAG: PQQ-dependent sugar dehydrogenase, partial [Nitrososphaeraceae archaeon]
FEGGSIRWEKNSKTFLSHSKDFNEYFHQAPREKGGKELQGWGINNSSFNERNGIKVETIFKGIQFPTSMAFLDSNDFLVLEKNNGTVQRIKDGEMYPEPLIDVNVANMRERGMLGIAIHEGTGNIPTYVFLYFTESRNKDVDNIAEESLVLGNNLYRYELSENGTKLTNPKLLLSLPSESSSIHNGGKLVISSDENLYLVVGDLGTRETTTQNSINGSMPDGTSVIYRLTKDGEAASDNPFSEMPMLSKYYAYGIRNSFGIDFDPITGKMWNTENGEGNFDEINIVEPGFNSGWKKLMGMAPSGFNFSNLAEFGGIGKYSDPEFVWNISIGVTALKFFHSDKLGPVYKDGLLVGDFVNGNLYFFQLNDNRTELLLRGPLADKIADDPEELNEYILASGLGGITDIQVDPDGYLYISAIKRYYPLIDTDGIIYRIIPGD